jgi:multiple RNA-binding domain-containing protein 1
VNDPSLPRPWSAHSVGSSIYEKKHQQQFKQQKPNNKLSDDKEAKDKKKSKSKSSIVDENNGKLREFLEVMQHGSKSKTWTNDDLTILDSQSGTKIEGSDDELYQDLSKKSKDKKSDYKKKISTKPINEDSESKSENSSEGEGVNMTKDLVSDFDWLKSRMKRKLDLEDDDDEDDEEVNIYLIRG